MLKTYDYTKEELEDFTYAKFDTDEGIIWVKLFPQDTPNTVANFASLVKSGFYDGLNFHRVIDGFMAQGGCPDGTGMGGPSWAIACETNENQEHKKGSLSMAHAGKDTGGSQFFICFVPCPHLDGVHTVFGGIEEDDTASFETLGKLKQGSLINSILISKNKD